MKKGLCARIAWGNIIKNARFFVPRLLAESGLLGSFYIILTLAMDERLTEVKGGAYLPMFMWIGTVVIGLLSAVIMFYTNSFLMRRRMSEFGLYNILGMEKRHIRRVMFFETLYCVLFAFILGLVGGMVFYKLASLMICRLFRTEIVIGFYFITPTTLVPAALVFILIDTLAYIFGCARISRLKPAEMLASVHEGEKEPKIKWVILILGALFLGAGYYISVATKQPLQVLWLFFVAVIAVIIGTYFLFTAGSVFVLKALKKNENFYYKKGHMTAVSGLIYRLKQNAVGLASVCILSTGVLVMLSTTVCLYSQTETTLKNNYPYDYYVSIENDAGLVPNDEMTRAIGYAADKNGLQIEENDYREYISVTYRYENGVLFADQPFITNTVSLENICDITFLTQDMYNQLTGEKPDLKKGEAAVYAYKNGFPTESFTLAGNEFIITEHTDSPVIKNTAQYICDSYEMIVATDDELRLIDDDQKTAYGPNASEFVRETCVSFKNPDDYAYTGSELTDDVIEGLSDYLGNDGFTVYTDDIWRARSDLYGMFGTLLFLGILLGLVCLFATVLIIYYKQISEGFEDRQRFVIMRRIGLSSNEILKTIRKETGIVFFLPLIAAGVHVIFAYPILTKMLELLLMDDKWLFLKWCFIVYPVFALIYAVIYRLTARTYYHIVS